MQRQEMCHDHFDDIAVGDNSNGRARVFLDQGLEGVNRAHLNLAHGLAIRKARSAWKMLNNFPHLAMYQLLYLATCPIPVADFTQVVKNLQVQPGVMFKNGLRRFYRPLKWA